MTETLEWLPKLITLNDHEGDWRKYCEAIYEIFQRDFIDSKPVYATKRFALKRHPEYDGKAATFWHLISEGKVEEERTPDFRRCERIAWPKPIIEAIGNDNVCLWKNKRGRNERILIAVEDFSYVVVLDDREDFVLLWTAFYVEYPNRRRRMKQEYEKWREKNEP
jgi:hypothetical protein